MAATLFHLALECPGCGQTATYQVKASVKSGAVVGVDCEFCGGYFEVRLSSGPPTVEVDI